VDRHLVPTEMTPHVEGGIVLVTHEFPPARGGIATYVEETARALAGRGVRVSVWAGGKPLKDAGTFPFRYEPIPNRGSLDWPCLWQTAAFLRARREIVESATVCFAEPGPIFASLYPWVFRTPRPRRLVLVLHGSEILRLAAFPHRRAGFRRLLKQADTIGVVSEYTRGLLERHFSGHGDRAVLVPGALRSDFQKPAARARAADDAELRVLTVARLHPRKGLHHTIAALGRLPAELKQRVVYQVVGPPSRPAYVEKLKRLAAETEVSLELRHDDRDLKQIYADADVFAMTSENSRMSVESFGLVYLEAGACGLPVVAFATGGVGEAVREGESGILMEPGDGTGLTAALTKLLESAALRSQLGEGGRRRAAERSWESNVRKLFAPELRACSKIPSDSSPTRVTG
jgi:phosphatidyl-myo-inositol dimannoside synthase